MLITNTHVTRVLLYLGLILPNVLSAYVAEEEFIIEEEQPIGTQLARLHEHKQAPPPYAAVQWNPNSGSTIFRISTDGVITLKARLDREVNYPSTSPLRYEVILQSLKTFKGVNVTIIVSDMNDVAPLFMPSNVTLNIDETTPITSHLRLGIVIDKDSGDNGLVTSRLSGDSEDAFELVTTNRAGETILDLVVKKTLDYEKRKQYKFTIVCRDSGHEVQKETNMSVIVNVLDVNDNAPYFTGDGDQAYRRTIHENATRGHEVITIHTNDLDSGENGVVNYRLNPTLDSKGNVDTTFAIDRITGRLYVNGPLDADKKSLYELVVVAEDNGQHKLSSSVIVRITVLDLNDNAPMITMVYLTDSGGPKLTLEKVSIGDFVARFSITDEDDAETEDKPDENNIIVELLDDDEKTFHLQERLRNVYFLAVSRKLTVVRNYELRMRATDHGGLTSEYVFSVEVVSEEGTPDDGGSGSGSSNDLGVRFERLEYTVHYRDTDKRDVELPLLRTRLLHPVLGTVFSVTNTLFSVDIVTGEIYMKEESGCGSRTIQTHVIATLPVDIKGNSEQVNTTVKFIIHAIRNNAPVFQETNFQQLKNISENTILGKCYDHVKKPFDPDCNETLIYFESSRKRNGYFNVDRNTGTICLVRKLSYEMNPTVMISITVKDKYNLESELTVLVRILPHISTQLVFNTPLSYHLQRSLEVGTKLAIVNAKGQWGYDILYAIVGMPIEVLNLISLDQTTGIITLIKPFDKPLTQLKFEVEARYIDDSLRLKAKIPLTFNIHEDDPSLLLTNPLQVFTIQENLLADKLGSVQYKNDNERITWVIEAVNRHIFFNTTNGSFGIVREFDYETLKQEIMNVYLRSSTSFLSCQILVKVINIIDKTPKLFKKQQTIIVGNTVSSTISLLSFASKVTVKLENNLDRFYVKNNNLYTLGLQKTGVYNIKARLTEELAITQNIQIIVRDTQLQCKFTGNHIQEGSEQGSSIGTVQTSCARGKVFFAIENTFNSDYVDIDPSTGELKVKVAVVDYEELRSYRIEVSAYGVYANSVPETTTIYVEIKNIADSEPTFERPIYMFSVRENQPSGTFIGRISVNDKENNINYSYELQSKQDIRFRINSFNGDIVTNDIFDYELNKLYEFNVLYSRISISRLVVNVNAKVIVNITNENDNIPIFTKDNRLILDNNGLAKFSATDLDNDELKYSIVSEKDFVGDSAFITVDPLDGVLMLHKSAVVKTWYTIKVKVSDGLHSVVKVVHLTRDLTQSKTERVEFNVNTDTPIYGIIGKVNRSILPYKQSSTPMIYSLEGGDISAYFSIKSTSGEIIVARKLPTSNFDLIYGPLLIKAIDADIWRPSRTVFISVNIIWNHRTTSLEMPPAALSSLHFDVVITDNTPRDIQIYKDIKVISITTESTIFRVDNDQERILLDTKMVEQSTEIELIVKRKDIIGITTVRLITINIKDQRKPAKTKTDSSIVLPEETIVGTAIWQDSDITSISNGNDFNWFEIDLNTGIIKTIRRLDAELQNFITLNLRRNNRNLYKLRIKVENYNDHSPEVLYSGAIEKDMKIKITAIDLDIGDVMTYALSEPTHNCTINPESGLITLAPLSEIGITHEILIKGYVRDNGIPSKYTRFQRRIAFPPIEVKPVFSTKQKKSISLIEGRQFNDIGFVLATIIDSKSQIEYSIEGGNEDNLFAINSHNGIISCNHLDYETTTKYNLTLKAKVITGSSLQETITYLIVKVVDINDNTPKIEPLSGMITVPWNTAYNQTITTISAEDMDHGTNGIIHFSLQNNSQALFGLDSESGRIFINGILPKNEKTYYLEVIASDSGKTRRLKSTLTVKVDVIQSTDSIISSPNEFPAFSQSEYFIGIEEGSESGSVLQNFDIYSTNGMEKLELSLISGETSIFSLERNILSTKVIVDAEIGSHYDIIIEVTDVTSFKSTRVNVFIDVLDSNDNAPYVSEYYNLHINEDSLPGKVIGQIVANDVDSDQTLMFEIVDRPINFPIRVQSSTGEIVLLRKIFYDDTKTLNFMINVSDGISSSSTSVTFIVNQSTENRHPPKFNHDFYYVNASEFLSAGNNLLTIAAVDLDKDDITYSLERDYELFKINEFGILSTIATLPSSSTNQYYPVTVVAKDQHSATSKVTALIQVIPNNDWKPEFTENLYRIQINENLERGSVIETLKLVKNSAYVDIRLIDEQQSQFAIGPQGGVIVVKQLHSGVYTVTARATNHANNRYTDASLMISVKVTNNIRPLFRTQLRNISVTEKEEVVYKAAVESYTGVVRFSISVGDRNIFKMDKHSGDVTLDPTVVQGTYRLTLKVEDASNGASAYEDIIVKVQRSKITDEYGLTPTFPSESRYTILMERQPVGTYICTVRALSDANVAYSSTSREFSIGVDTGVITSQFPFDRSVTSERGLNVTAISSGSNQRGYIFVRVIVLADDNLSPTFVIPGGPSDGVYSFSSVTIEGDILGQVHAISGDSSTSIKYRLYSGDRESINYSVNTSSGVITRVSKDKKRKRRSIQKDESLHVMASVGTRSTGITIRLTPAIPVIPSKIGSKGLSGAPLIVLIVCIVVALVAGGVVLAVWLLRKRDRQRKQPAGLDNSACDVINTSMSQPTLDLPPYRQTLPDLPPESSGRGSAIDYDGDEEIRMINSSNLNMSDAETRAHDSGIARDSEADSQLHHQYLTSLGVPVVDNTPPPKVMAPRIELSEMLRLDGKLATPASPLDHKYATIDEIAAGSYNWDHLLGWTPAYQPLADVFAEIARLKDDNRRITGRKLPTRIVEQNGVKLKSSNILTSTPRPPPMITDAPPLSVSAERGRHLSPLGYDDTFAVGVVTPSLTPQLTLPDYLESVRIKHSI